MEERSSTTLRARSKWDVVWELFRTPWVRKIVLWIVFLSLGVFVLLLVTGLLNCSVVDGSLSCARTATILVERQNELLINATEREELCGAVVAVPSFRSSVINYGGITDIAYHNAFADIFSVALGKRYHTVLVELYANTRRQEREDLLSDLTPNVILKHVQGKLKDYVDGSRRVLFGHIYVLREERQDTGDPATILLSLRLVTLRGKEIWQAAHILSIESTPPVITRQKTTGGVGGFEAAFRMASDFVRRLDEKFPCRE